MPDASGLEVLRLLGYESLATRVLVLTASIGPGEGVQALQLGAQGLILKAAASQLLFEAIRAIMDGTFWIDDVPLPHLESCLRQLISQSRTNVSTLNLTPREREILAALVDESSNRDIAVKFGISEITVKHHLNSLFDKCGTSNRVELVLFALRHGLARL